MLNLKSLLGTVAYHGFNKSESLMTSTRVFNSSRTFPEVQVLKDFYRSIQVIKDCYRRTSHQGLNYLNRRTYYHGFVQ